MVMRKLNELYLNKLCDMAYKNACDIGYHTIELGYLDTELKNKHSLDLVAEKLLEAADAEFKCNRANVDMFNKHALISEAYANGVYKQPHNVCFEAYIKDTVEDKLADAAILLLDLARLRNISFSDADSFEFKTEMDDVIMEMLFKDWCARCISVINIYNNLCSFQLSDLIIGLFREMFKKSQSMNIDIFFHIEQKIKYQHERIKILIKK